MRCYASGRPRNCWFGISAENQAAFDDRYPFLAMTPAHIVWVSHEPALGEINIRDRHWFRRNSDIACPMCEGTMTRGGFTCPRCIHSSVGNGGFRKPDWWVCGGESGKNAHPSHPVWIRTARDCAVRSKIAFHFKQWGQWAPSAVVSEDLAESTHASYDEYLDMWSVGKKAAGRVLDGRTWDEFPEVVNAAREDQ